MFMFTRSGRVQLLEQDGKRGMILADTRETAQKVVAWFKNHNQQKITIAEIGTAPGETLEIQLNASLKEGANCAFLLSFGDAGDLLLNILSHHEQHKG